MEQNLAKHLRKFALLLLTSMLGYSLAAAQDSDDNEQSRRVLGYHLVKNVGLYTQFERRGWPAEYWSGQVIQNWVEFDPVVGTSVAQEVSLQLDKIKALGVNTITFELRSADTTSDGSFPACDEPSVLGFQFPQPTATELTNLPLFFDLVRSKGMRVWLRLVNTHMEQQPPTNSQTWLSAILDSVGRHPALDLVIFDGNTHGVDITGDGVPDVCGAPAEAPLYLGPGSVPARYVQWAISLAIAKGLPARKLSCEAIVGSFFLDSQPPAGPDATGSHLWSPIAIEKSIFDNLHIPAAQRTYALSFYEHRKCSDARFLSCTDADPHTWADQTLQNIVSLVGTGSRIVAPEMGNLTPVDPNWNTQHALESLIRLLHKYGLGGGSFWRWVSFNTSEDFDPSLADPVKRRGVDFVYNPVQKEVIDLGGLHVPLVQNGSFEDGVIQDIPVRWTAAGQGTAFRYLLTQEPGEPEVPSRGSYAMRIVTGTQPNSTISATSELIPISPATAYTTTANMRFDWTGDPNPSAPGFLRPQVFVHILYFQESGRLSGLRGMDSFSFFQEDRTNGFATFPLQYCTPKDAAFIRIRFGAARKGLPTQITLDVDNVR